MQQLLQSETTAARRRIPVYMVSSTDGSTPVTGITFNTGDIKISKNGAAEANHSGTVTEIAGGLYYYEAAAAELDTFGFITLRFSTTGARPFVALVQVLAVNPYVADAMLDAANSVESSLTVRQMFRLLIAVLAGKTTVTPTGSGTATVVFRDTNDTKNRVSASMTNSSRTTVTYDES